MAGDLHALAGIDRTIHEPARLVIVAILHAVERADFLYLLRETGLTRGNLSAHLVRLEEAGYIEIEKGYHGKVPRTVCRLTGAGRDAFRNYRAQLRKTVENLPE